MSTNFDETNAISEATIEVVNANDLIKSVSESMTDQISEMEGRLKGEMNKFFQANVSTLMEKCFNHFATQKAAGPPGQPVPLTTQPHAGLTDGQDNCREDDMLSVSVHSDSEEVDDAIARRNADTLSDILPKPPQDVSASRGEALLAEVEHNIITEEADDFGDSVQQHVAARIKRHFEDGRVPSVKNAICAHYKMPKNCSFLAPKKLNDEIRQFEGFKSKPNQPGGDFRERNLYNLEQQLARVSTILTLSLSDCLEKVEKAEPIDVKGLAKSSLDAISMVSNCQSTLDNMRKDNIKGYLKHDVRSICQHGKYHGDSQYLFGDSYSRLVKETRDDFHNLQQSVKQSED